MDVGSHNTNARMGAIPIPPGPRICGWPVNEALAGGRVKVSFVLPVELVAKLMEVGLKPQARYCESEVGRLHAKFNVPVKSVAVHGIGYVVVPAAVMVIAGGVQLTLDGGPAMPDSCTSCGLPEALSIICSVAASTPAVLVGLKFTLIMQSAPAAMLSPSQLVLFALKSPRLGPTMPTAGLGNTSAAVPVFVTVTVCGAEVVPEATGALTEPNVKACGLRLAMGTAGGIAVPFSAICCGLFGAVSAT